MYTLVESEGWEKRERIRVDLDSAKSELNTLESKASKLKNQIRAIRERPEVQEQLIRDEMDFVKQGDLIIEVHENTKEAPEAKSSPQKQQVPAHP
ncbi:hypothetical protein KAI87_13795 [Myxococcota bacterium]|nr:hypothetical protein [Myxococcota bacterium]